MPHPKFKKRYFEIKLKSASASFFKTQRPTSRGALACDMSVNFGRRGLCECGCRVRLMMKCGRDPDPERAAMRARIADVARL